MKLNKKFQIILISLILIFIFTFEYVALAYYPDTDFVWSESTVQTSSDGSNTEDFLNLTCESAILIEQTTRKNFI